MSHPIVVQDVLTYNSLNISPQYATSQCSVLSNGKLCVRQGDPTPQITMVDLANNNATNRQPFKGDLAIMHPSRNYLALYGNNTIQVYDLSTKNRIKQAQGVAVTYWTWANDDVLAFVSNGAVYHILLSGPEQPMPVFQLQPQIASCQILSYSLSHDGNFAVISGLAQENNQIVGKLQFFSREQNNSQGLDGFCGTFANINGAAALLFVQKVGAAIKFNVFGLGNTPQAQQIGRKQLDFPAPAEGAQDIPLFMIYSQKYSSAFVLTRLGYLFTAEVETPHCYLSLKALGSSPVAASLSNTGGVYALCQDGKLVGISINEATIVNYISQKGSPQVATKVAGKAGIQMSGDFLTQQFDQLLLSGNYDEAARIAATSGGDALRGQATINKLHKCQPMAGTPALVYYMTKLVTITPLNEVESIEFCRQIINMGKGQIIEQLLKEEKLTSSEGLGDIIKKGDLRLAASIYARAQNHSKACATFAEMSNFEMLQQYCQRYGYSPDWIQIISIIAGSTPENLKPALAFVANNGQPIVDPQAVVSVLMQYQQTNGAATFLIEVLTEDREEDSDLQTLLFEITLTNEPRIAEELFSRNIFNYYDRQKIAGLCERASNYQRALEHYSDPASIKRCIVNTQQISPDFLVQYFADLQESLALECLKEMLTTNMQGNVQIVVKIAGTYYNKYGIDTLLNMFNQSNASEAIYYFLAQVVTTCEEPDVHFRYIEAAAKLSDFTEVERMCRESNYLQAERVRDFLMQSNLSDNVPLIVLCNRFEFIEDLTKFLYKKGATDAIETYVTKFNQQMAGRVIGGLIDIEAPQQYIQKLIAAVQHTAPMDELIKETMKRERLRLLQPILEQRAQTGSTDRATNNGIVLLAYNMGRQPERMLRENKFYDPKFVGDILAKRDAHLACIAYAKGECDKELIDLTNQHQLYKEQARYLVSRSDEELWATVLTETNDHMQRVVDAVTSTALPECDDHEKVSTTVRAFLNAEIPHMLINLLEKIVLENPQFQNNVSLQNLLIITAAESDQDRVMTYVQRLNDYTWDQIAIKIIEHGLYNEAIVLYKKFDQAVLAVKVMLENKNDLQEAADWAAHCNIAAVWAEVARAQLANAMIVESIESFIKAKDTKEYQQVIKMAEEAEEFRALVNYLELARQFQNSDPIVESELLYSYARCDMLSEMEELVSSPNAARTKEIADRCFEQKLFKACKILYNAVKDYGMLAETLIELNELQQAIEAARKASSTKTWKAVNRACVLAGDFKLAEIAGLQIVVEADQLGDIIKLYEDLGYFQQIIALLEAAQNLERAHGGIFTELSVLYAKHQPEKCMEHLKQFHQRMSLFRVIKALDMMHMWRELVFAYDKYSEYDNAVLTCIEHPATAWTHNYFKELVGQVSNPDILYRSLNFYIMVDPMEITDLLNTVGPKVDPTRLVDIFRRSSNLQLIKTYLASIQSQNVQAVNEALNQMHVDDGDYEALRKSVDTYTLFDQIALARQLQVHECLEFRRISSYIYRKNERWNESIEISKKDEFYQDAIETASESKSSEIVEDLLKFFLANKLLECFAAALYVCYDQLSSDVVLDLAWRNNCTDFAMPYLIQTMREQNHAIAKLQQEVEKLSGTVEETKAAASASVAQPTFDSAFPDTGAAQQFPQTADPFAAAGNQQSFQQQQYAADYSGYQQQSYGGFAQQQGGYGYGGYASQGGFAGY